MNADCTLIHADENPKGARIEIPKTTLLAVGEERGLLPEKKYVFKYVFLRKKRSVEKWLEMGYTADINRNGLYTGSVVVYD